VLIFSPDGALLGQIDAEQHTVYRGRQLPVPRAIFHF